MLVARDTTNSLHIFTLAIQWSQSNDSSRPAKFRSAPAIEIKTLKVLYDMLAEFQLPEGAFLSNLTALPSVTEPTSKERLPATVFGVFTLQESGLGLSPPARSHPSHLLWLTLEKEDKEEHIHPALVTISRKKTHSSMQITTASPFDTMEDEVTFTHTF